MDQRVWQSLAEPTHEELIRLAAATDAGDVAAVSRLRKVCADAELVRAALMLAEARRKGAVKFGFERAAKLWADPQGVEMASSLVVADHKAKRFSALLADRPGLDLCCGIGGDAMMLGRVLDLTVVDLDPVRVWMAERNSGRPGVCEDARTIQCPDGPVHIDPARRDEAGRVRLWNAADLRPSLDEIREIMGRTRWGGAVKLGPGANLSEIEQALPNCSVEVISERGSLVQTVAWCGKSLGAVPGEREATLIVRTPERDWSAGSSFTLRGRPGDAPVAAKLGRYLFEPDDSIERAGLFDVLCAEVSASMLDPRVGLLTSDRLIDSPWLTTFAALDQIPWHERRVKAATDALGAGIVEVKTRGGVVDPDVVQRSLRGTGERPLTVFVLRFGREVRAIIARRV